MARQRRPTGPSWPVDETWKIDVLARMKALGISRADLARRLAVSPASMTLLFKPETKQTRLKPAIHRILGLVDVSTTPAITRDEAYRRLMKAWPSLTEEEREILIATGELLAAKIKR